MKLEVQKRLIVVTIYREYKLHYEKNKFEILRILASRESIYASKNTMRRIIKKWQEHSIKLTSIFFYL